MWGPRQVFTAVFMLKSPVECMSYQSAIGRVCLHAGAAFGWKREPDAAGLSRARRRLEAQDVRKIWDSVLAWATTHASQAGELLPGMITVAIDGTTLHVPRTQSTIKAYGLVKNRIGLEIGHYPQAQLVSAWDMDRRIPLAWNLTSKRVGERASMLGLLDQLPAGCVMVMDRGFPARDLLGMIVASRRQVVIRMVSSEGAAWPEVAAFLASGKRSAIVLIKVRQGRTSVQVPMRLVRRVFKRGRPHVGESRHQMVIMTNLVDPGISDQRILDLYHGRWGIETIHREMKSIAQVERWHGKTKALIEQEVTALMCWFAIAGAIATRAEADAAAQDQVNADQRPPRRVNTRRVFEAVNAILDWQYAAQGAHDQIVGYLRGIAMDALDRMIRHMRRRRPGRWLPRMPKHPYARRVA